MKTKSEFTPAQIEQRKKFAAFYVTERIRRLAKYAKRLRDSAHYRMVAVINARNGYRAAKVEWTVHNTPRR